MALLGGWDDLVHGTVVFGAALPFAVALAAGMLVPARLWIAAALALAGPFLWFFGVPDTPLSSDDALVSAFGAALLVLALDAAVPPRARAVKFLAGSVLWGGLAWFLYPAWLAAGGGLPRRLLVAGSMAVSITAFGLALGRLGRAAPESRYAITPAALIPLGIGLAVLLVTGGASQFAQSSGALAASMAAVCLVLLWKDKTGGVDRAAAFWGMLLGFLAWAGWLFAEICPGAAALLFASPFAALAARFLPLPRHRPILAMTWDGLAAALAVAPILALVLLEYAAEGAGGSEGY